MSSPIEFHDRALSLGLARVAEQAAKDHRGGIGKQRQLFGAVREQCSCITVSSACQRGGLSFLLLLGNSTIGEAGEVLYTEQHREPRRERRQLPDRGRGALQESHAVSGELCLQTPEAHPREAL
mgnify:CR=1 FL=1